ncbi:MAG: uracil-DNA glycosylase [Actinobacteria bacterium]|uniref:Unannotated protein n=1 Tax=freshwater metagenome TaxID=449393 RepID=A0A6J5ZGE7_9ZZZZ|nr:uracil-DNA glycosylase [Actinomycetota bacterium]
MDLWQYVPAAWRDELEHVRPQIAQVSAALSKRVGSERILPAPEQVFRALQIAPNGATVIVMGQDPYPNPRHACGLSFSVPPEVTTLPASLRNILTEVRDDVGGSDVVGGDLQLWADQGVVLLNRVLTVGAGEPNSHSTIGWQAITDAIVASFVRNSPNAIAILWGAAAQQLRPLFNAENVVYSVHPSPLSAYRGFFGSHPFSRVNEMLLKRQMQPIRW